MTHRAAQEHCQNVGLWADFHRWKSSETLGRGCITVRIHRGSPLLQEIMTTATMDICFTGASATNLWLSRWATGMMLKPSAKEIKLIWPVSTQRKNWASSLVSSHGKHTRSAKDILLKTEWYFFLLSAAHLPAAAWIGLNDISNENHFVYADGTPAVSHLRSAEECWRRAFSAGCLCALLGLAPRGA